jgi:hypothetical protein
VPARRHHPLVLVDRVEELVVVGQRVEHQRRLEHLAAVELARRHVDAARVQVRRIGHERVLAGGRREIAVAGDVAEPIEAIEPTVAILVEHAGDVAGVAGVDKVVLGLAIARPRRP